MIFVLDASGIDGRNPVEDFKVLRDELKNYNPEMLERPYLIALNKIDTDEAQEHLKEFRRKFPQYKTNLYEISASRGDGLSELLAAIENRLKN